MLEIRVGDSGLIRAACRRTLADSFLFWDRREGSKWPQLTKERESYVGNPQLNAINLNKVTFQNFENDANLDGFSENEVWTRSSSYTNQVWQMTKVDIHEGEEVFTITMTDPTNPKFKGKNLEVTKQDGTVRLATPEPNKLSQRWVLRFQEDRTVIQSMKYLDFVLTGTGIDQPVLLRRNNAGGNDAQKWTPYNKEHYVVANEDSRYSMETGV